VPEGGSREAAGKLAPPLFKGKTGKSAGVGGRGPKRKPWICEETSSKEVRTNAVI